MSTLFLTEPEVERLLSFPQAIEAVEEAFRALGRGAAQNVPRHRARAPGTVLHMMGASAAYLGFSAWKCYFTTAQGAVFHLGLYEHATGRLVALMQANRLGQVRTGATSAVAARWLAPPGASKLGLFGSGFQARGQLEALAQVLPLKQVFVYSRDPQRRAQFAQEMSQRLPLEVTPVDRPQEAAEELPVVITATTSREPVLDGRWLAPGALVIAVGSNWWHKAELDLTTIRRAHPIVCDDVDCCRLEAGDFRQALEHGVFDWSEAISLAEVVCQRRSGRTDSSDVVLFKSVGMALEDVAVAVRVYQQALQQGLGTPLPLDPRQ